MTQMVANNNFFAKPFSLVYDAEKQWLIHFYTALLEMKVKIEKVSKLQIEAI